MNRPTLNHTGTHTLIIQPKLPSLYLCSFIQSKDKLLVCSCLILTEQTVKRSYSTKTHYFDSDSLVYAREDQFFMQDLPAHVHV